MCLSYAAVEEKEPETKLAGPERIKVGQVRQWGQDNGQLYTVVSVKDNRHTLSWVVNSYGTPYVDFAEFENYYTETNSKVVKQLWQ